MRSTLDSCAWDSLACSAANELALSASDNNPKVSTFLNILLVNLFMNLSFK
jgi:hypothetical protein